MINYGVVYPQAILIFVITILYSVVQPLIAIFGALYFGIAYFVYKYKLLFGKSKYPLSTSIVRHSRICSLLQALRIAWPSVAADVCPADLGNHHFPDLHDWHPHPEAVLHHVLSPRAACAGDCYMGLVHVQDFPTVERCGMPKLRLRGREGGRCCGCREVEGRTPSELVAEVR